MARRNVKSGCLVPLPALNPDCVLRSLLSKVAARRACIIAAYTLYVALRSEIGRYDEGSVSSPLPLKIETTVACDHAVGIVPRDQDWLYKARSLISPSLSRS